MWVFDGEQWTEDEESDGWPGVEKAHPPAPIEVCLPELQVQIVTPTQRPVPPPPPM